MHSRRVVVALIAALATAPAGPASAQPDPAEPEIEMGGEGEPAVPDGPAEAPVKDPKLAKKLVTTGQQAVAKGDAFVRAKKAEEAKAQYETALTAFTKALELGAEPAVHLDLGNVLDKLGRFAEAATQWRLATKAEGVKPDVVKKATARLDDALMNKVGLVILQVKPDGATVSIEGVEVGTAPLPEPLILMPGTHKLTFAAEGFQPKEAEFKVEAGSESERTVELEPIKVIIETKPPVDENPVVVKPAAPPPSKLPLFVGGGATVAFLATTTITGILAVGQHGTFTADDSSAAERADAKDKGERLARISDVALAGTLVAGAFTAYWYFAKYKPAQRKYASERNASRAVRAPSKLAVVPWVQPASDQPGGGLTLAGSF